jgi:hypothetical protein
MENEWIDGLDKPTERGLYERLSYGEWVTYSVWNGEYWCWGSNDPKQARTFRHRSINQTFPWRKFNGNEKTK